MHDIATADDIQLLVEEFYGGLTRDALMGHFFAGIALEHHLPRIRAFWEMALLGKPGYTTNVTDVHLQLAKRIPMQPEHFARWLELWRSTIDMHFAGPLADEAKLRALSIATVIQVKTGRNG